MKYIRIVLGTLAVVTTLISTAKADVRPIVAVFDIETRGVKLKKSTRKDLSDYLAAKMAETGFFRVVPREDMRKRLLDRAKESYKECYDQSCQIELGRELSAQKILSTQIIKIGDRCTVTSTLYDLKRSATDLSAVEKDKCDDTALQRALDKVVLSLSKRKTAVLTPQEREQYLQEARNSIPGFVEGRPLSPYLFVLSNNPQRDRLPLKKTEVHVDIAGMIADVHVTQYYKNEGETPVEALYMFPISSRGAISQMRLMIGERVIEAEIQEKGQARETYEKAREEGRTASLLEKVKTNVYQMNVANILPGDDIKVSFRYSELLVPEKAIYEFVYPTVTPPRYASADRPSSSSHSYSKNPYLQETQQADSPLVLALEIRSGIPVAQVESPSHKLDISYEGPKTVRVKLHEEKATSNFVLRYSLAGKQIESGLLLYPGTDENFFLLMLEPPARVSDADIVPREYIFVMDVSGSMQGFPIKTSKKLMRDLLSHLRGHEYFNLILFSDEANVLFESSSHATEHNVSKAFNLIDQQSGAGGTKLLPALRSAVELPRHKGTSRTVVVVSDGIIHDEEEALVFIHARLTDANVFPFGIGSSIRRPTMEALARAGMGEPFMVIHQREAQEKAKRFRTYISTPLLQGIKVGFKLFETYDMEPEALGDLFAERPVVLFGKYKGEPKGSVQIQGHVPGKSIVKNLALPDASISEHNSALRHLWARHRIQRLTDLERTTRLHSARKEFRERITALGLKYGLATQYTSFVAADQKVRASPKPEVARRTWKRSRPAGLTPEQARLYDAVVGEVDLGPVLQEETPEDNSGLLSEDVGDGLVAEFALLEDSPGQTTFALNLDPVTLLASGDGGTMMHYGSVDFLFKWPLFRYWNPYLGLGMGYFAPRIRLGVDIYPLRHMWESGEPIVKLGGRYMVAFKLSDTPDRYNNFDPDNDFVTSFMAEIGIGWHFRMLGYNWQIVAMYLVGSAWPAEGGDDRSFGDLKPTGSALFHGGTLSLTFEF